MLNTIFNKIIRPLLVVFTFLTHLRDWVLVKGSRTVEVGNTILMFAWSATYAVQKYLGLDIKSYEAFERFDQYHWYWYLMALSVLQGVFTAINSIRCNVISGFLLLISCAVWMFISVTFASVYAVHTGITTYALAAVGCFAAGSAIMTHNDDITPQYASAYCSDQQCDMRTGQEKYDGSATIGDKIANASSGAIRNDSGGIGRVGASQDGQRWIPVKRYFHRVWRRVRSYCKRLLTSRTRK